MKNKLGEGINEKERPQMNKIIKKFTFLSNPSKKYT